MFIELMFNDVNLACGTAFYYRYEGKSYLVSNWHNFSGRDPKTKKPISKSGGLPNRFRLYSHHPENCASVDVVEYELLKDGGATWFEHPDLGCNVDVGVLPISELPKEVFDMLSAVDEVGPNSDSPLEVGESVFVLGFPFGITAGNYLPIWKAATIASEPEVNYNQLPLMLIDTATRPGMSGSPVIQYIRRPISLIDNGKLYRFRASFVGVYSGRLVGSDSLDAQLGLVWKAKCINDIIVGETIYRD